MRALVSTIMAGMVFLGTATLVRPAAAALAPADSDPSPAELYDQGRKAYRLGDFETAVRKWELAFELSDLPLLLYNISLGYKGLYGITRDIEHLRRARAVLDNFIKLAEVDPNVEVDDAHERLAELDQMIADAEAESQPSIGSTTPPPDPVDPARDPAEQGKRTKSKAQVQRNAGIGLMATGGGLLLVGAGLATYFGIKSQEFGTSADDSRSNATLEGCDLGMPSGMGCRQYVEDIETWEENQRAARLGMYISASVAGGLGVAALVTGAVLFSRSKRASGEVPQQGFVRGMRIEVGMTGLRLSGRF